MKRRGALQHAKLYSLFPQKLQATGSVSQYAISHGKIRDVRDIRGDQSGESISAERPRRVSAVVFTSVYINEITHLPHVRVAREARPVAPSLSLVLSGLLCLPRSRSLADIR